MKELTLQEKRNLYYRERYKKDPTAQKTAARNWKKRNPNHSIDWANRNPYRYWSIGVRKSHITVGHIVNISTVELEQAARATKKCQFCDKVLKYGRGGHLNNSASIDRIDNEKTLDKSNVCIICISCNTTKGSKTFKEFVAYCASIGKRFANSSSRPVSIKDISSSLSDLNSPVEL